jgi:hypothetical protein
MDSILRYRLGWVSNPLPEHEMMRGRLCIPYLKKSGIVALKFRCIQGHKCKDFGHVKYLSDGSQWLYNTFALDLPGDTIGVCEGEIDAITLNSIGVHAVGIPGVESWKGHLARQIQESIPRARIIPLPEMSDVNSTFVDLGGEYLKELAGV